MSPSIASIVEGQSEEEAVPVLLRRILAERGEFDIDVARPFRIKRNRICRAGEIERAVKQVMRDRESVEGLLILLDAEDDCPMEVGTDLKRRAASETNRPVAVVLAKREFEAWFLAAKESLRGRRGIRNDAVAPPDPEAVRGAKEEISRNMAPRRYLEVDDQPAFAETFSIQGAQARSPSFGRLLREMGRLVDHIRRMNSGGRLP